MTSLELMPHVTTDPNAWSKDWSNAVFSIHERKRRWSKIRKLMKRDGVDLIICLPCTNAHDRGQANARYFTQLGENSDEVTVAFPVEGKVTAWQSRPGVWPSSNWLKDIRSAGRGAGGATISSWLEENRQYRNSTIATAGLDANNYIHCRAAEGEVNWQSVQLLKERYPKARFVSATPIIGEARWRKSTEEIDFLRRGVEVAEATLDAVRLHARPGVAERHVFAHMMFANADAGGSFTPMLGWTTGPLGAAYHRLEQPSFRKFRRGDVFNMEIEGRWGGHISQIDQTAYFGKPPKDLQVGIAISIEAFDRTIAAMRPGATMRDLVEAARVQGLGGRAHSALGMHGRGTGDDGPLVVADRPDPTNVLDMVLEEGCCFAVKPSTILDGTPDYCKWGDTVVVTRRGAERLGTRPQGLLSIT